MPGASLASQAAAEGHGERSARCAPALGSGSLTPSASPRGTCWRLGGKNALQQGESLDLGLSGAGIKVCLCLLGCKGLGHPPEDQLLLRSIPVGSGHGF